MPSIFSLRSSVYLLVVGALGLGLSACDRQTSAAASTQAAVPAAERQDAAATPSISPEILQSAIDANPDQEAVIRSSIQAALEAGAQMAQEDEPAVSAEVQAEWLPEGHSGEDQGGEGDAGELVWTGRGEPLSVQFKPGFSAGYRHNRFIIRSHADHLQVRSIELNRGNCPYAEVDRVLEGIALPVNLVFGRQKTIEARCDQVIEAVIATQYGSYTFEMR